MSAQNKAKEDHSTTESTSEPQRASKSVALNVGGTEVEIPIKSLSRRRTRSSKDLRSIADDIGVNPFEILLYAAGGDFKALGYDSPIQIRAAGEGTIEEEVLPMSLRIQAAKEAAQYLYPKKRSVEITGDEDQPVGVKFEGNILELIKLARG